MNKGLTYYARVDLLSAGQIVSQLDQPLEIMMRLNFLAEMTGFALTIVACSGAPPPAIQWQHLSSQYGELPVPGESTQQTDAIVGDFDGDGVNDFILSFRQKAPSLVWYRRVEKRWDRYVIDQDFLTMEAGVAEAKSLGLTYVGTAGIPHDGVFTEASCRKAASDFNRAGELMAGTA